MENKAAFFYSRVLFWGFGISLILNITGTGFWISELLGALIGLGILILVKKTNDAKWFKVLTGCIFAFLAAIIIANLGGTMYLKETPNYILAFVPLIVGFIVSRTRGNAFKRTISMLFFYTIFMFFVSGGILVNYVKPENLLPLSFNIRKILEGTIIFVLTSVTPVLCLNDFKNKKEVILNYSTSIITVIVMSLLIVCILGNQEAMLYRYPEFILLKRIKIYEFFSNVENLFVIMIVTDFIATIATGFKNMKFKGKVTPYIPLAVVWFCASYACSHTDIMTFLYKYYPIFLFFLAILTIIPKRLLNKKE